MTRRRARRIGTRSATLGVALLAVVLLGACVPTPTPTQPDPLISCASLAGSISYTPPATGDPADTTLDALDGTSLTGCTDHTGAGITGGDVSISVLFPDFDCSPGVSVPMGTVYGSGSGLIEWSDGSTSEIGATVRAGGLAGFSLELGITDGRWAGARAAFVMQFVSSTGSCGLADPITAATFQSNGPVVLHPGAAPLFNPRNDVVQVAAAAGGHSCAVLTDGSARCWGADTAGQLGNLLLAPGANALVPVEVTGLSGATQISGGIDHTCAVVTGGSVRCWGSNESGKLGTGTPGSSRIPQPVAGLTGVVQVELGSRHSCALLADGTVRCWGANDAGQLGDGTNDPRSTPVPVVGLSDVAQIDLGDHHSCARSTSTVQCWGDNQYGQLGIGGADRNTPVGVFGVNFATDLAAGGMHTCVANLSGAFAPQCWGWNRYGQLGIGTTGDTPEPDPRVVQGDLGAVDVTAGGSHTCARLVTGSSACWGNNAEGQLGEGTTTDSSRPRLVFGLHDAQQLSAGGHTCALRPSGRAECWGNNHDGQLGDGTTTSRSLPVSVASP